MDRFRDEDVPLSVSVIDMDWHLVEIDPEHGSGWTGYTWNTDLFPDPQAFLAGLHERGLAVSLNVHPAEGVHAHEASYAAIAKRMGIDPDSGVPVAFDPTDPDFLEAYFEELHHPHEDDGVDFWWLDWQQGGVTRIPGLDPLWLLNHFHYLDSGRAGKRPLTFSRYAGIGSHRYPVGFSGDTHMTWESLDFQPSFTATASNAGYGWWSHDIGGHFKGYKDDELTTRWVQLGVFSPILRLHSGLNPFNTREPWRFDSDSERVMTDVPPAAAPAAAVPRDHERARPRGRADRAADVLRPPRGAGGVRRPAPVHVRHRAAGRADHLAARPVHRSRPGHRLAARGHLGRRLHRGPVRRRPDAAPPPRPRLDPGAGPGRRDRADGPRRGTSAAAPTCPRASRCGCTPARTASSPSSRTATTSAGSGPG